MLTFIHSFIPQEYNITISISTASTITITEPTIITSINTISTTVIKTTARMSLKIDNKYKKKYQNVRAINKNMITARRKRKRTIEKLSRQPNRNFTVANTNTDDQVPDLTKDMDIDNSVIKSN